MYELPSICSMGWLSLLVTELLLMRRVALSLNHLSSLVPITSLFEYKVHVRETPEKQ